MAIELTFGDKTVFEPGVYSQILSGIKNPPLDLSYGNVLIIDTGSGAGYGSGAGVNGVNANNKGAIQVFDNLDDYRKAMKGGVLWFIGKQLFQPKDFSTPGVSKVNYIRAATTSPASLDLTFEGNSGEGHSDGGTLSIVVKDEGLIGNGISRSSDEIAAVASFLVTTAGTAADTIQFLSDEGGTNPVSLGTATVPQTPTVNSVATAIMNAINAGTDTHGYSAAAVNALVTITAPIGRGTLSNSYVLSAVKSQNATVNGTITNWHGGINGTLVKGYGIKLRASVSDATKFVMEFYVGTYRGLNSTGNPWNFVAEVDAEPYLLCKSDEFSTVSGLLSWALRDQTFNKYFLIADSEVLGSGNVVADDIANYLGFNLFAGGMESYSSSDLDKVLLAITEVDYTFLLADKWNLDSMHATCGILLNHILKDSRYGNFIVIGGGNDASKYDEYSRGAAIYYNNSHVILVHAGLGKKKPDRSGIEFYESIVKAAAVLGRICGLPPQVPATLKGIDMDADSHNMMEHERRDALKYGVLHTYQDSDGEFVINQAINTLQNNQYLVDENTNSSYEVSVMRIASQLNKELVYNGRKQLLKQEKGANRNTLSKADVKNWTEQYLMDKCATPVKDNLIISFRNVVVVTKGDGHHTTYGFEPNFPINKMFFTGFMLDPEK